MALIDCSTVTQSSLLGKATPTDPWSDPCWLRWSARSSLVTRRSSGTNVADSWSASSPLVTSFFCCLSGLLKHRNRLPDKVCRFKNKQWHLSCFLFLWRRMKPLSVWVLQLMDQIQLFFLKFVNCLHCHVQLPAVMLYKNLNSRADLSSSLSSTSTFFFKYTDFTVIWSAVSCHGQGKHLNPLADLTAMFYSVRLRLADHFQ